MDNENEASSSGGFGKDYHGQDAFGERIGGTGIGGNHFGGFEEGHFGVGDGRDHFEREANSYGDITQTEVPDTSAFEGESNTVADSMRESLRGINETGIENSNTGSTMDTSFQIGGTEEDKEKYQQEYERAEEELNRTNEWADKKNASIDKNKENVNNVINQMDTNNKSLGGKLASILNDPKGKVIDTLESLAKSSGYDDFDRNKIEEAYKDIGTEALRNASDELFERMKADIDKTVKGAKGRRDNFKSIVDSYKSSTTDKTKTSFTDKMEPSTTEAKTEAKAGTNMSNAKTSPSDYLTKSNKDSTKEMPKDYRNDYGNHTVDTLKGVVDRVAGSTTAEALGLKSVEEFARENGYDPEKLSTMKAYMSYQNKEIMKAIPGIVKQIGSYITERVKDAVDPSQLPERIRNTLARYNLATLIGAAILSMNSGAGLQASIDQALTMVDTEDQAAVSDYLEDVLNDEGTVNDLKTAFDDALAPQQNSASNELDESVVNIGRKNNTDYDDFNAGLGSSGTTSDADVKVFIARNVKADPILRKMIAKIGK